MPAFMSSISVMKSTCRIVQLVPWYQTAVLSYQLVLKLAEILDANLRKEVITLLIDSGCLIMELLLQCTIFFCAFQSLDDKFDTLKQKLSDELHAVQQRISEWRDDLLQNPLLTPSKSLTYPKEIEVHSSIEYYYTVQ